MRYRSPGKSVLRWSPPPMLFQDNPCPLFCPVVPSGTTPTSETSETNHGRLSLNTAFQPCPCPYLQSGCAHYPPYPRLACPTSLNLNHHPPPTHLYVLAHSDTPSLARSLTCILFLFSTGFFVPQTLHSFPRSLSWNAPRLCRKSLTNCD